MLTANARAVHLLLLALALLPLIPAVVTPLAAAPSQEEVDAARTAVAKLTPYDVGSRYGQALGAEQICTGTRATPKAHALDLIYTEADLQAFKAQASRIYNAWTKIEHCKIEGDPNQCRIVVDESCAAAISDVGPSGTVLPGLLEGAQAAH